MSALPEHEAAHLTYLLNRDKEELKSRVLALRDFGWTFQSIADALGTTRASVHYWAKTATRKTYKHNPVPISVAYLKNDGIKTQLLRPNVSDADALEMRRLLPLAQKVRKTTPDASEFAKAAVLLDSYIRKYLDRGVPVLYIARALGVTHRAVQARIERRDV